MKVPCIYYINETIEPIEPIECFTNWTIIRIGAPVDSLAVCQQLTDFGNRIASYNYILDLMNDCILQRYTIFGSVFQFIIPLAIITGIYVKLCSFLRVKIFVQN